MISLATTFLSVVLDYVDGIVARMFFLRLDDRLDHWPNYDHRHCSLAICFRALVEHTIFSFGSDSSRLYGGRFSEQVEGVQKSTIVK